jgi:TPR repeat protein
MISLLAGVSAAASKKAPTLERHEVRTDKLAVAHAALRSLQFDKAVKALSDMHGNPDAQQLLGLMYLNGVGVVPDAAHAHALLTASADGGNGAAAFVLAGEAARDPAQPPEVAQRWLQRATQQPH